MLLGVFEPVSHSHYRTRLGGNQDLPGREYSPDWEETMWTVDAGQVKLLQFDHLVIMNVMLENYGLMEIENSSLEEKCLKECEGEDYYMGPIQLFYVDLEELVTITCK